MLTKIGQLVEDLEKLDTEGFTQHSEYVEENMRENINKTEAYLSSKHISGETDYMGREKPFFNIVLAARNVWYRATDIDRKDIRILPDDSKTIIPAFLATIKLQEWMKKAKFGKFLNKWGLSLANHGSSIVKFVKKGGMLFIEVMDWNNMLCDPIDFDNNIKVQKLWFTPAQLLREKSYDKELVKKLINSTISRETTEGQKKDNKSEYIEVFEVHGEMPLSYLTGKEDDDDTFVQQMHVITFQATKENEREDITLYSGREAKDPYMITHLIEKDGQTYVGGAVMNLFEAQWMVNHSQKTIKDQLDIASLIVWQTADPTFQGRNVLKNIEQGHILTHKPNMPLTQLNNQADIGAIQSFQGSWMSIANQINGVNEAMLGEAPKSGTAWRQTRAILSESHSLFELMTENKALYLEDMFTERILPYIQEQLENTDEIGGMLEDNMVKEFDARYLPNEAIRRLNQKKKDIILNGGLYEPQNEQIDLANIQQQVKSELVDNNRFVKPSEVAKKTWKEVLKDLSWKVCVYITGENKDLQGMLETLTNIFQSLAANPAILQDPNVKSIFNKILSLTGGMSPLELSITPASAPMAEVGGGKLNTNNTNYAKQEPTA